MARQMKDSGIEWIGMIPAEWEQRRLKYILCERNEKNDPIKTREILSLTAIQGVIPHAEKEGGGNKPKDDVSAYKLAYPNDIVMNSMNVLSGAVGLSKYHGCVSPVYYMLYSDDENIDIRFYNYMFKTKAFQRSLMGLGNGILIKETESGSLNTIRMRIPIEKLNGLYLFVPDYLEQIRIVEFLEKRIPEIDAVISKTKESIKEYKQYKQSVITEIVTKGLRKNAVMKDSGIEWIGQIPEAWKMTKIKFLYEIVLGKMLCNEPKDEKYTLENYLCSQNVKWKGVDTTIVKKMYFSLEEKQTYFLRKGDLLITEGGSVGESCIYDGEASPCYIQNALHKANGKNMNMNKYLFYWMQVLDAVGYFSMICNRATIAHYTKEKVENTPIISIPFEEQYKIVEYLDIKCGEIDTLITKKEAFIEEMESYKQSLIYEYVTGKKEVL